MAGEFGPALGEDGEPLDQIALTGLRAKGFHGVFTHERRDGQDFVLDVVLHLDLRRAAVTDDLADTADYGALATGLAAILRGEPVNLLERLVDRIAARCLDDARVRVVDVAVHKPQAPITEEFADVVVAVRRRRGSGDDSPQSTVRDAKLVEREAVISMGANLGDRLDTLRSALRALRATPGIEVLAASPVFETDPVGGPDQPDYLNAVCRVRTTLAPEALLARCLGIEADHGRTREVRWGARTLDLDLIVCGQERRESRELVLPHPRAAERAFVLVPWAAMDPDAVLLGRRVGDLAAAAPDRAGVRARPDLTLVVA